MQKQLATPRYETLVDYLEHALHTNRDMHICIENCPMVDILRYIKPEDIINNLNIQPRDTAWHLRRLGFNPKLSGYRYLLVAIPLLASNPDMLMKEIYIEIFKQCDQGDSRSMERAIRTTIQDAWEKHDPNIWSQYFQPNQDGNIIKPTVKQFIYRLAEEIE